MNIQVLYYYATHFYEQNYVPSANFENKRHYYIVLLLKTFSLYNGKFYIFLIMELLTIELRFFFLL